MKIFFYILVFGISPLLFSQNSIHGIVLNEEGNPLFGVQIYNENLHMGTTSDESGYFELNNFPNGIHQLIFSYIGFQTEKRILEFPYYFDELKITLTESVFHMEEVLVSSPFHKIQDANVMKVVYKSIKSLEKNGGATLIQNLTTIPGVAQFSTGTGIGKPVIRGLSGNRVLVYAQGVRMENQQFGGEHGLGLNEAGVESVEVIKGPASLLYGSDALGGVLYFNPEKFALNNETQINLIQKLFSNTLGSNTSISYKSSKYRLKYLIRGTYSTHSDYKIPDGNRVTNTRFNEKDFKAAIGYNSKKYVSEIRYNFMRSNIGLTEGIESQSTSKTPHLPFQNIDNHILSFHNHFFFDRSKIDLDLGYTSNNRKEFEDNENLANLNLKLNTFTYDLKYHLPKLDKLETIIGIQGMHQENLNFGEEILIPNAKINNLGLLTTALWNWNKNNSFQGGVRLDLNNLETEKHIIFEDSDEIKVFEPIERNYKNITTSLGYKTQLFDNIITRINMATGFRAPNLAELTSNGVHEGTFRYEIGNPDLKSEQNYQMDLSLEYKNKHFEVYVNTFYNKLNNYIFIAPINEVINGFDVYHYLQENAKLYGGEFGLHLHPHPLDWLHLESSFEMVTGKQNNGNYLPLIPANKLANTIRGEFNGYNKINDIYISLKLETTFKQDQTGSFETNSDGYNILNYSMGANIDLDKFKFLIGFNINNIFNTEYISHLSALKMNNIPNIGRNFMISINFDM